MDDPDMEVDEDEGGEEAEDEEEEMEESDEGSVQEFGKSPAFESYW